MMLFEVRNSLTHAASVDSLALPPLGVEGIYGCVCALLAMATANLLPTADLFHQSLVSAVHWSLCTIKPLEFHSHFLTFKGCQRHMELQGEL